MDDYEEQVAKAKEKLEEEKYQELYQKQAKIVRIVLLATFLPTGLVFLISGISFLLSSIEKEASFIFLGLGIFFCLFGIILYLVMPKKGNYQKYKTVVKRRGGLNLFDLSIRVGLLEDKLHELELENQALKKHMDDLERKYR